MLNFNSLVIGLVAVIAMAPTAQAFTSARLAKIDQPATNLQADAAVIFGIKFPQPQSQPVIIQTPRYPQPIYREVYRDSRPGFANRGHYDKRYKHRKGRKHHRDQYQHGNHHEDHH